MRQRLRLFPRATVMGDAHGHSTRYEDPGPSHLLLREKSSKCAGPPCGTPRRRGVLVSLSPAAGDGGPGVASAPGQPRSGFRGVDPGRDRPSSAHAPCRFLPAAKTDATGVLNPGLRPGSKSCGLLDSATCPAIVRSTTAEASRRRSATSTPGTVLRTGSRAPSSHARFFYFPQLPAVGGT